MDARDAELSVYALSYQNLRRSTHEGTEHVKITLAHLNKVAMIDRRYNNMISNNQGNVLEGPAFNRI